MAEIPLADHFAAAFGGGPDRQEAFEEGRMKRAQTERALAEAAKARDLVIARQNLQGTDLASPDSSALADIILGGLGSDYSNTMQGSLRGQEFGFREQIADPGTQMDQRQYAAQAVSGRPVNFLDAMGQGHYADIRKPEMGVQATGLGDAMLDAEVALAEQRRRPPEARPTLTPEERAINAFADTMGKGAYEDSYGDPAAALQSIQDAFNPAAPATDDELAEPQSKADYEALPSGTRFLAPDGTIRIKP